MENEQVLHQNEIPKTSRLAKASFILGLIGILIPSSLVLLIALEPSLGKFGTFWQIMCLVILILAIGSVLTSIILGIIALVKIKGAKGLLKGKGLAISGIIISAIAPVIYIGICFIVFVISVQSSYHVDKFDPNKYQGETGSIILPYKGESSLVVVDVKKNSMRLNTTNGILQVPVGTFTLESYEAIAQDDNNSKWTASCYFYTKPQQISVQNNSSQQLGINPSFIASIGVNKNEGNWIRFNFNLTDKNGVKWTIDKAEPAFQVISKSGEILWQDKFKQG